MSRFLPLKTSFFLLLIIFSLIASHLRAGDEFVIMSYNCENMFDTKHDEGKNDLEFLPDGTRRWNITRMTTKIRNVGKVIAAASDVRPVDIVCLEEVENDSVMTELAKGSLLAAMGYEFVMTESADRRGIDVALMYSPFTFRPISVQSLRASTTAPTRDILHVSGVARGRDTLDIYVLHLPSKLGGREGELNREAVLRTVRHSIDSLQSARPAAKVVVMGDFNDNATAPAIAKAFAGMENVSERFTHHSYKYQGRWETIDHIFISQSLFSKGLHFLSADVFAPDFLLTEDIRYGGKKPLRTFNGYDYTAGFSDHLPVLLRLEF